MELKNEKNFRKIVQYPITHSVRNTHTYKDKESYNFLIWEMEHELGKIIIVLFRKFGSGT